MEVCTEGMVLMANGHTPNLLVGGMAVDAVINEVLCSRLELYCKHRNFRWGLNSRASAPTKIKPMKLCTHKELATVIMVDYSHPQKFIPSKV